MARWQPSTPKVGWFSIEGAALYTGFSVGLIRTAIKKRRLKIRRVPVTGGENVTDSVRIRLEWLDAWCDGREIIDDEPPACEMGELVTEVRELRNQLENQKDAYPRWMKLPVASRHCGSSPRTLKRRISEGCFASKLSAASRPRVAGRMDRRASVGRHRLQGPSEVNSRLI